LTALLTEASPPRQSFDDGMDSNQEQQRPRTDRRVDATIRGHSHYQGPTMIAACNAIFRPCRFVQDS